MRAYDESQKVYWDNYAVMETAKEMAKKERDFAIARAMKEDGHPVAMIAKYTGLTEEQIEALQ